MTTKEFLQGQRILESGQKIDTLYLIMRGVVSAAYPEGSYSLHSGDVVGLCEIDTNEAYMDYKAESKLSVIAYPLKDGRLLDLFDSHNNAVKYFISSLFRQINAVMGQYKLLKIESASLYDYVRSCYEDYVRLCEHFQTSPGNPADYENLERMTLEEDIPMWIGGYYSTLEQMLAVWDSNKTDNEFVCGFLTRASQDVHNMILLCNQIQEYKHDICRILLNENGLDLSELLVSLYSKAIKKEGTEGDKTMLLRRIINDVMMQLETQGFGETKLFQVRKADIEHRLETMEKQAIQPVDGGQAEDSLQKILSESINQILEYAACGKELRDSFKQHVEEYKKVINKNGTEEGIRSLRQMITKEFYQIYIAAFHNSLTDSHLSTIMRMFFNFGYVDEELAGMENACCMYRIAENLPTLPEKGIYSYYEWLMAIYRGKKEPSRNEFDLDYSEYLHEQKRLGKISQEEENALLQNQVSKVMYELENVFPIVNKITFGRVSTFCPVFSEHNALKDLESTLVSGEHVLQTLENIRKKDFSAYYRETLFTKPEKGINKEFIHVEVLPDIILTPNIGTRGVMWQEIEGKRRNTPARMLSSIFQMEDFNLIMIRLTGEFRWEMCKRIQGARWNDISERSLTSEYFDYMQFYRKNQELSSETKDKIKTEMGRAKNSFKEMFIMDYLIWILYESNGAPRLNKVARGILFHNCAFAAPIREKLKVNPLYRDLIDKYNVHMGQKRHRMDNLCQKLTAQGKDVPEEIKKEKQFLYM